MRWKHENEYRKWYIWGTFILITVASSTGKTIICFQRNYQESLFTKIINPAIDTSCLCEDPHCSFKSQPRCLNPYILRVINLSSLTYPFFELDIEQYDCNVQTFVNQARINDYSVNGMILLLFAISWYFGVIVIEVSMRKGALIREGCLIQT